MVDQKHIAKILVAEDDPLTCKVLEKLSTEMSATVKITNDGEACLAAIDEFKPDILLLDVEMPKLTGIQVLEKLREDNCYDSLIVIMLTGSKAVSTVGDCLKLGAKDYVIKPIEVPELAIRLKSHVAYVYLEDLKFILKSLRFPEEKIVSQLPGFKKHGQNYDAYPVVFKNQKLCVVLPKHLQPKMLVELGNEQLFFEAIVFIKTNTHWRQVWPHAQSLKKQIEAAAS